MTCGSCGNSNPAGIEFCEVCGTPKASRGKTELAQPPDAARKSRTLYDPGPSKPVPSPSDVFANPGAKRSGVDPHDPFKSSIVSASPVASALPARRRNKTVLAGPAPAPSDLRGVLCVYESTGVHLVPLLPGRTALGRDSDADIVLSDPNVSGSHAFIYIRETGASFIDVSRNGSIVDDAPIIGETAALRHGSVVRLGDTTCVLLLLPVDPPTADTP